MNFRLLVSAGTAVLFLAAAGGVEAAQFQGVVATVGGDSEVTAADVRRELQQTSTRHQVMGLSPREAAEVGLQLALRRRLVLHDIKKRNLLKEEFGDLFRMIEIRAISALYRDARQMEIVVTERELDEVTPADLMERRRVRYIVCQDKQVLQRVLARVRAGEDFAALAREFSEGPAREKGGDIGWLEKGTNPYFTEEHWQSVLSLPAGGVTEAFSTPLFDGWAIVKVDEIQAYPPEEVAAVREANRAPLKMKKYGEEVAQLLRDSKLTFFEEVLSRLARADRREELVTFKGGSVTAGVFRRYLEKGQVKLDSATQPQLRAYLEDFAELAVVAVLAKRSPLLNRNPNYAAMVKNGSEDVQFNLYIERLYAKLTMTDAEVERYYREHPEENRTPEQVDLWQIHVASQTEADEVLQRLKKGEEFESLAMLFAQSETESKQAGHIGLTQRGAKGDPIMDTVFSLSLMEISKPIATRFGYYIFQVRQKIPAKKYTLAERAPAIRAAYAEQKKEEAFSNLFQELEKKYPVKVNDAVLDKI